MRSKLAALRQTVSITSWGQLFGLRAGAELDQIAFDLGREVAKQLGEGAAVGPDGNGFDEVGERFAVEGALRFCGGWHGGDLITRLGAREPWPAFLCRRLYGKRGFTKVPHIGETLGVPAIPLASARRRASRDANQR